jgi:hypothetical protein
MLDNLFTPTHLFILLPLLGCYLLPTIISIVRHHPNHIPIAIINIFFGCTAIGWIVAFIWSISSPTPFQIIIQRPPAPPK